VLAICHVFLAWQWHTSQQQTPESDAVMVKKEVFPKNTTKSNLTPLVDDTMFVGRTKIVAFCNYNYRSVAIKWYNRMTELGYNSHVIVATDQRMAGFLFNSQKLNAYDNMPFRYQVLIHEPIPHEWMVSMTKTKFDHSVLELLMAVRWKFLQHQLEQGIHVLLTDVDNVFSRYIPLDEEKNSVLFATDSNDGIVDVWHAYATKYPRKVYSKLGFVVCSGMSWWRASPAAIRFAKIMHKSCGSMCDDQRVLNNLLIDDTVLNMTWFRTQEMMNSRISSVTTTDDRFLGLPTIGISGYSSVTGHRAKIWDRDFAFRGPVHPEVCPPDNWVSMPILEAKSRGKAWLAKLNSFDDWDSYCGESNAVNTNSK
jgi:hypothetical protein